MLNRAEPGHFGYLTQKRALEIAAKQTNIADLLCGIVLVGVSIKVWFTEVEDLFQGATFLVLAAVTVAFCVLKIRNWFRADRTFLRWAKTEKGIELLIQGDDLEKRRHSLMSELAALNQIGERHGTNLQECVLYGDVLQSLADLFDEEQALFDRQRALFAPLHKWNNRWSTNTWLAYEEVLAV